VAPGLSAIDWQPPWLDPWREAGAAVQAGVDAGDSVAEAANGARCAAVRFVPQPALPAGMAYERFIFETGQVPTRDNLHDFFNALCWMVFPQAKRRLNQIQAAEIEARGVSVREPVRDAITVLDENGALLQAPDALWEALAARQWQRLFGELRPLWAQAQLAVFGHAALEKLVTPYKSITVHVWRAAPAQRGVPALDAWLAADLSAEKLAGKPFVPLPVLGVPGWWPANEDPAFYADTDVFRPVRRALAAQ
jgi:hypothetical protein